MHGVAVDSYCEQYSHKYRKHYFIQRFSLVVSHHQEQIIKYNRNTQKQRCSLKVLVRSSVIGTIMY